jgi:hypothetical protein
LRHAAARTILLQGTEDAAMRFSFHTTLVAEFFLFTAIGAFAGNARQHNNADTIKDRVAITILVYDDVRIHKSTLAAGERQAAGIFRTAGIETVWIDCASRSPNPGPLCHQILGEREFVLHIVSHGKVSHDKNSYERSPENSAGKSSRENVFGISFLDADDRGRYCDIFYDRIREIGASTDADPAQILGAVAAHELGHLLLGSNAHTVAGIMAPSWQKEELRRIGMGAMRFNSAESAKMQLRLFDPPPDLPERRRGTQVATETY